MQTTILNLMKMAESSQNQLKTLWEKEKLLITSNFSFPHIVFRRLVLQTRDIISTPVRNVRSTLESNNKYSTCSFWFNRTVNPQAPYGLKCIEVPFCINPFANKPLFLHVCSTSLLKTLREKEKLLVTSNFSFSHSVFKPI